MKFTRSRGIEENMMKWRKSLYEIIEVAADNNKLSKLYDWFMMIAIVASIIPLAVRNGNEITKILDEITVIIFIVDYIFRLLTADFKLTKGMESFIEYPFTPISVYANGYY